MTPHAASPRTPAERGARLLLAAAVAVAVAGLCRVQPANAETQSGLIVVPHPAAQQGLSYFRLATRSGGRARAGAVELRNTGPRPLRVSLAPVEGQTLSTLGSGYAPPGSGYAPSGSGGRRAAGWLRIGRGIVVLAPGRGALVPVAVEVPRAAASGDYLAGVSIEALDQGAHTSLHSGVSIASVDRYVIGVEVSVPGPRHPLIRFTGAEVQRQPAGVVFLLLARNPGNVILQDTHGQAVISEGRRTVASVALGPGTFVTGTGIAYPIPTPRERPHEGTVYRVRAYLRYAGGVAWLDTGVRFGRAGALTQQAYGGPRVPARGSGGPPVWLVAALAVLALLLALGFALLLLRRRRTGERAALGALDGALHAQRDSGEPLSVLAVTLPADAAAARVPAVLRSRLRKTDRLLRLSRGHFLVVAADTDVATARALAMDLRRQLERTSRTPGGVTVAVHCPDEDVAAAELLQQIREGSAEADVLTPSG